MIEKIVPFSEHVLAVFKVALHQFNPPVGSRVLEPHYPEPPCMWDIVFIDSHFADVYLASVLYVDSNSVWYHVLESLQFNLTGVTSERLEYHFLCLLRIQTFLFTS